MMTAMKREKPMLHIIVRRDGRPAWIESYDPDDLPCPASMYRRKRDREFVATLADAEAWARETIAAFNAGEGDPSRRRTLLGVVLGTKQEAEERKNRLWPVVQS